MEAIVIAQPIKGIPSAEQPGVYVLDDTVTGKRYIGASDRAVSGLRSRLDKAAKRIGIFRNTEVANLQPSIYPTKDIDKAIQVMSDMSEQENVVLL